MKLLLIEDDAFEAESITQCLRAYYSLCQVDICANLEQAVSTVKGQLYDALLLGIYPSDAQFETSVQELVNACKTVPIVVLSNFADETANGKAIAIGAQDVLIKGRFNCEILGRTICNAIERHELHRKNEELLSSVLNSEIMLREKNRRLEKACKTAQEFVDNVSHEFRTPLTVIMEYASLLADSIAGPVTEDQAKLLSVIDDRASDLNNMVDDMLDVSKLETGLLSASRSPCHVQEIIDHVLPAIQRKALVREVELSIDVAPGLPDVFCDREKAGRVIINLAVNAIKFCGNPGRVRLTASRRGHNEVVITVADNGRGIPLDQQQEIFRRFEQGHTELKDGPKGFGLGLNIAQELVKLNFGQLSVQSETDCGSKFSFTLPINDPIEVTRRYIERFQRLNRECSSASVFEVTSAEELQARQSIAADRFFSHLLRQNDLAFRVHDDTWILIVYSIGGSSEGFVERFNRERQLIKRSQPRSPIPECHITLVGTWDLCTEGAELISLLKSRIDEEIACYA